MAGCGKNRKVCKKKKSVTRTLQRLNLMACVLSSLDIARYSLPRVGRAEWHEPISDLRFVPLPYIIYWSPSPRAMSKLKA